MQYIINKQHNKYMAWQLVQRTVDNGATGLMPGDHSLVGFCGGEVIAIVTEQTRSFAYGLAIVEYHEDDAFLKPTKALAA